MFHVSFQAVYSGCASGCLRGDLARLRFHPLDVLFSLIDRLWLKRFTILLQITM
jgi:hypothetical protein